MADRGLTRAAAWRSGTGVWRLWTYLRKDTNRCSLRMAASSWCSMVRSTTSRELRTLLESAGHRFRGHSDTEVLLAGICEWGFEQTLKKSVGMFAIALWDQQQRTLSLARDRIGEKPLYYGWQGSVFMFCSELKPLRAHPKWAGDIDRNSVALLMRYGYIPAPHSVYSNIRKLPPGAVLNHQVSRSQATRMGHTSSVLDSARVR